MRELPALIAPVSSLRNGGFSSINFCIGDLIQDKYKLSASIGNYKQNEEAIALSNISMKELIAIGHKFEDVLKMISP